MFICRECEKDINTATEVCPHCGADLTIPVPGADEPKSKPTLQKVLLRWGILLAVLLGTMWSFLWFIVPERQGNPTTQAEDRALAALTEAHSALGDYAAVQNGSYPQDFASLDQRVRAAAQLAQSVNYQLQYTPGPAQADGAIHGYTLLAVAGNFGFRNFYVDETGIVHATRENRPATAQDPPI
jgi:rRNA maturation protein Nop10